MRFCLFIFLIFSSFSIFSQINNKTLLESQRKTFYIDGKDHLEIDKTYSLEYGAKLPALVKKETSGNLIFFTYKTYMGLNDANRERIMERLTVSVPAILSISNDGDEIRVSFSTTATSEDFLELFRLTGYSGYEIMN
ncbi:MAG TPA: hypothetical protein PLP27_08995 [Crocinitomicaceae bacterium]|nr:hypothetical protein [Crocinitomicaceae bacterium]